MQLTERDLWWIAGFLEGEGSFDMASRSQRIHAAQVNPEPILKLQKLVGGKIYEIIPTSSFSKNPQQHWHLGGEPARELMVLLYPLMSAKRQEQIITALKQRESAHDALVAVIKGPQTCA